jgi:GPH family glycoside/pentoside/hexuronide:cation symporter
MTPRDVAHPIRLAYGVPALGLAALQLLLNAFLPKFYTDEVGLSVTTIATVLLVVRLFDAITDPLTGFLSDHTHSRWGRRRPWMFLASLPLALTFLALCHPEWRGNIGATTWFTAGIFAVYLFWTAVSVPYESLGAELSLDYDERTSLLGIREMFLLGGTVLAAASPTLARWIFDQPHAGATDGSHFSFIGWSWGTITLTLCLFSAWAVPERFGRRRGRGISLRQILTQVWANRSFRILLIAYTVAAFGSHLPATMLLYYTEHVLGTKRGDLYLLLYMAMAILALPLWIRVAQRFSKRSAWIASLIWTLASFIWALPLGPGDVHWFVIIAALSGTAGGAVLALPHAMQADVIDEDELVSGERREGQYIGLWSIAKKVSAALGIALGLSLLGFSGYEPNQPQPAAVKWALRIAYIVVPCLSFSVAIGLAWRYPLDRVRHQWVREQIGRKETR